MKWPSRSRSSSCEQRRGSLCGPCQAIGGGLGSLGATGGGRDHPGTGRPRTRARRPIPAICPREDAVSRRLSRRVPCRSGGGLPRGETRGPGAAARDRSRHDGGEAADGSSPMTAPSAPTAASSKRAADGKSFAQYRGYAHDGTDGTDRGSMAFLVARRGTLPHAAAAAAPPFPDPPLQQGSGGEAAITPLRP